MAARELKWRRVRGHLTVLTMVVEADYVVACSVKPGGISCEQRRRRSSDQLQYVRTYVRVHQYANGDIDLYQ